MTKLPKTFVKTLVVLFGVIILFMVSFQGGVQAIKFDENFEGVQERHMLTRLTDITPNHWAYDSIRWAYAMSLVRGYPDQTFRPDNKITESEFLAILLTLFPAPRDIQDQVQFKPGTKDWYEPYYTIADYMNYPTGKTPDWAMTRSRVAELFASVEGFHYSGNQAIQYVLGKGLAKGKVSGDVSIEAFRGGDTITRAEACRIFRNMFHAHRFYEKDFPSKRPLDPSDPSLLPSIPKVENKTPLDKAVLAFAKTDYKVREYYGGYWIDLWQGTNQLSSYSEMENHEVFEFYDIDRPEHIEASVTFLGALRGVPDGLANVINQVIKNKNQAKLQYEGVNFDIMFDSLINGVVILMEEPFRWN